jgi:hypothetical protein
MEHSRTHTLYQALSAPGGMGDVLACRRTPKVVARRTPVLATFKNIVDLFAADGRPFGDVNSHEDFLDVRTASVLCDVHAFMVCTV